MTSAQINILCNGLQPCSTIETHISWVLLTTCFAYKIKKPVAYSFVDFTEVEMRKHYCEKEIVLNLRLTDDVYIGVVPVVENGGSIFFGPGGGNVIDYAVKMHRLPEGKRMDILLAQNRVTLEDIRALARKIATFHINAPVVYPRGTAKLQQDFNDIANYADCIERQLGAAYCSMAETSLQVSGRFLKKMEAHIGKRIDEGFYRDCHGDLHTSNIFLLPAPEPFDCVEFNDSFRHIDVLNEAAFLCMSLDAHGREDFSAAFLAAYQQMYPAILDEQDELLFNYYKAYRANIRAKISCLAAQVSGFQPSKKDLLQQAKNYFYLMQRYLSNL